MKISIVLSDMSHPVRPHIEAWIGRSRAEHAIELVTRAAELSGGDILFLISCHEIIRQPTRDRYAKVLVIHASDLPEGRGWSPHVWSVLAGAERIVVTLLEAADGVDTGPIWTKTSFPLEGHELCHEINERLFAAEIRLMDFAVGSFGRIEPQPQPEGRATYHPRRKPEDSRIDPARPLIEQMALLRVADPDRYPAWFEHAGHTYEIVLRKRAAPAREAIR